MKSIPRGPGVEVRLQYPAPMNTKGLGPDGSGERPVLSLWFALDVGTGRKAVLHAFAQSKVPVAPQQLPALFDLLAQVMAERMPSLIAGKAFVETYNLDNMNGEMN